MLLHKTSHKVLMLSASTILLVTLCVASIAFGLTKIAPSTVFQALFFYDDTQVNHIIIQSNRVNRAVLAVLVGSGLACSGVLLQALTRNALASPSLFGINAGALFFIVLALTAFSLSSLTQYVWFAFLGASLAALLVLALSFHRGRGFSSIQVVLAGAAITALFVAFTQGLLIFNRESLEGILFWLGGSVSGRSMPLIIPFIPMVLGALVVAWCMSRQLNVMQLSDDMAKGLGQKVLAVRLLATVLIVVLAGSSVALAGMIGFIGLIVPHLTRGLFGPDHRWVLPGAAVIGACILLAADIVARFIVPPQEVPVGVMTAFLGTPVFLFLVSRKRLTL